MTPGLLIVCFVVLVAVSALAPRIGVAAPLALVAGGVALSYAPGVDVVEVDPDLVLAGILPPLLYASAVNMPTLDFRRELRSITWLSVVVVVVSALLCGLVVSALVPGVGFAAGMALGAVISPTDAVATSIVKEAGVAPRVVTVLDGEGLLNDATALVLLRSAVAGGALTVGGVAGDLLRSLVVAVLVGAVVGWLTLQVRSRIADDTLNVATSFVVPYLAFFPAEEAGASGLVAAVVAGLVVSARRVHELPAAVRRAESTNWHSVSFLLEGAVFLLMGLQTRGLVEDFRADSRTWVDVALVGGCCLLVLWGVRAAFVATLVARAGTEHARGRARTEAVRRHWQGRLERSVTRRHDPAAAERRASRVRTELERREADLRFYADEQLRKRDGGVLFWAGLRGAVTLAAAQTIPAGTAHRPLLVLTAFALAVATLVLQGGTLSWLVTRLGARVDRRDVRREHGTSLAELLAGVADSTTGDIAANGLDGRQVEWLVLDQAREASHPERYTLWAGDDEADRHRRITEYRRVRQAIIDDQREALLDARASGRYDSAAVREMLLRLDAGEMTVDGLQG
ncbi:cation:proton antiporter [Nocardioides bruguierae]|uniref:cation:proton antiporter n=1 Tax=Nocardioides bruguierae TaxID=2945102 RepID=UPI002021B2B9|nr:cation:proton antiporter [Nocardioides bruguierae]MCL8027119.1 cation:proton antiporter [Nocardioides bruguierae]